MISVVMCSVDTVKSTRAVAMYERLLTGTRFEIHVIDDAEGLAEGYNRGVSRCRGDWVIFTHDNVEFLGEDFQDRLLGHMNHCDVLGVAGTRRLAYSDWALPAYPYAYGQIAYPNYENSGRYAVVLWSVPARRIDRIQAMDGVFVCARRTVVQQLRFDQTNCPGFHLYDVDFTFRAFLSGCRLSVAADLYPLHSSGGKHDASWQNAAMRFSRKFERYLAPSVQWAYRNATVVVPTVREVIEVMTPPHWGDGDRGREGVRGAEALKELMAQSQELKLGY